VAAVGSGVSGFAVGDRVVGTPGFGGFAEQVVVAADACDLLPAGVSFVDGAVLPIAFGTALHALRDRASLREGETLLVTGATGGVGSAVVKVGRLLGARVVAAVGSVAKVPIAQALGADLVVTYGLSGRQRIRRAAVRHRRRVDVAHPGDGGDGRLGSRRHRRHGGWRRDG
jgi:NADPH2:quinone reductase